MRKYRPSNGTEGMAFVDIHCCNCIHGKYEHTGNENDKPCEILSFTMAFDVNDKEYPEEWQYDKNGNPTCTAFKKWDWDQDEDGNWNDPPPDFPDDPNQLCLPFIFEEIGINDKEGKRTCPSVSIP